MEGNIHLIIVCCFTTKLSDDWHFTWKALLSGLPCSAISISLRPKSACLMFLMQKSPLPLEFFCCLSRGDVSSSELSVYDAAETEHTQWIAATWKVTKECVHKAEAASFPRPLSKYKWFGVVFLETVDKLRHVPKSRPADRLEPPTSFKGPAWT